jgi:hypothetical protein
VRALPWDMKARQGSRELRLGVVLAILAILVIELVSLWGGTIGTTTPRSSTALDPVGTRIAVDLNSAPAVRLTASSSSSSSNSGATPAAAPSPRAYTLMTYDAKDGYILLFGGLNKTGLVNATWKFSAGKWTELHPKSSPPASFDTSMTYDGKTGYVLLLDNGATWRYSGGAWSVVLAPISALDRLAATMTYDTKDGYVLLFGGYNSSGYLGDTWKFVGGAWTRITTSVHPLARAYSSMTYDAKDGYVVLFGGCHVGSPCTTGGFLSDTWTFASGTWTKLSPSRAPSPRGGSMMTYDATDGYVLFFGGCNSSNCSHPFSDTWTFSGGIWTHPMPTTHPSPRLLGSIAYDAASNYVVLFGGGGPNFKLLGDTWTYSAGVWTMV